MHNFDLQIYEKISNSSKKLPRKVSYFMKIYNLCYTELTF